MGAYEQAVSTERTHGDSAIQAGAILAPSMLLLEKLLPSS